MKKYILMLLCLISVNSFSQKKITQFKKGRVINSSTLFQGSDGNDTLKTFKISQIDSVVIANIPISDASQISTDTLLSSVLKTKSIYIASKTVYNTNYTATVNDHLICDSATSHNDTIFLPDAYSVVTGSSGLVLNIKKISIANSTIVKAYGSQKIDGAATYSLITIYNTLSITARNGGWDIGTFAKIRENDTLATRFIAKAVLTNKLDTDIVQWIVKALKYSSSNLLSVIDCYYPILGTTQNQARWNLINPNDTSYRLSFINPAPTVSDTGGIKWNGGHAKTKYVENIKTPGYSQHISYYSHTYGNKAAVECEIGADYATGIYGQTRLFCCYRDSALAWFNTVGGNHLAVLNTNGGKGYFISNNKGSSTVGGNVISIIKNGVTIGTVTKPGVNPATAQYYIGKLDQNNIGYYPSTKNCIGVTIGKGMNSDQIAELTYIMNQSNKFKERNTF